MTKKRRFYFAILPVLLVGLVLIASQGKNPEMRQPQIVGAVEPLSKNFALKKNVLTAKRSAEYLDQSLDKLLKISSMSRFQKWIYSSEIKNFEQRFSQEMESHLSAMTQIMKYRRGKGGLKKLQEFDFQNMLRKSDYLLALSSAKERAFLLSGSLIKEYRFERNHCHHARILAQAL